MECIHCKSTWNSAVRMSTCPFCGKEIYSDEIKVNDVSDALRKVVLEKSLDIFNSPKIVISLVSDYVAGFQREKKLLKIACSNGALKYVITIANEKDNAQRELHIKKLKKMLIDDAFLSDDNAILILNILLASIESSPITNQFTKDDTTTHIEAKRTVSETTSKSTTEVDELSFEELLERTVKDIDIIGKTVTGMLMDSDTGEVWLDSDEFHIGYLPVHEVSNRNLGVTDSVKAVVVGTNSDDGTLKLSCERLDKQDVWNEIEEWRDKKLILEGVVEEVNQGGLFVTTRGIRVFVPASYSGVSKGSDLTTMVGSNVDLIITDVNLDRRRAIGSISEAKAVKAQKIWDNIKEGSKFPGIVKVLTSFGAFVDIGGVDGMIHISQLSTDIEKKINQPSDVLSVGDKIEVYVISFDKEKNRISLGYKIEKTKTVNSGGVTTVQEIKYDEIPPYKETIRRIYHGDAKVKSADEYAAVNIRFEPCECEGLCFENHITDNSVPKAYIPAIEKGLMDAFKSGPLAGCPVNGIKAVLISGSYHAVYSTAKAFEKAARIAFENSYSNGAPVLLEEFIEMRVTLSDESMAALFSEINSVHGRVMGLDPSQKTRCSQAIFEIPITGKTRIDDFVKQDKDSEIISINFVRYEKVTGPDAQKIIDSIKNQH